MTRGDQTAPVKESDAGQLRILGRLHPGEHIHLLVVPQQDRVVQGSRNHFGLVWDLLLVALQLRRLQSNHLQDGSSVARHILLLDLLFQTVGFHYEVCEYKQNSSVLMVRVLDYLNLVDFHIDSLRRFRLLFSQVFDSDFVFFVDVDNVQESSVVCSKELLLDRVPKHASVDGFVWIFKFNLFLPLRGFKPTQSLIIADRENEVLLCDKQHLNNANSVSILHFVLHFELDVR